MRDGAGVHGHFPVAEINDLPIFQRGERRLWPPFGNVFLQATRVVALFALMCFVMSGGVYGCIVAAVG